MLIYGKRVDSCERCEHPEATQQQSLTEPLFKIPFLDGCENMPKEIKVFSTIIVVLLPITLGIWLNFAVNETDFNASEFFSFNKETEYLSAPLSLRPSVNLNKEGIKNKLKSLDMKNLKYYHSLKKEGWQLIWQDEFEKDELDLTKWNTENWAAEKNNELQFYTPYNVTSENGLLRIISKKENYRGRNYTSGAIHSKNKFSFQYGKVEMSAKLPKGQGIFPAFWMMPNLEETWLPEIDIIEMVGHKPEEIWMVYHWIDDNGKLVNVHSNYIGKDFSQNFHTFGIEWSPENITWLIDGKKRFSTDQSIPSEEMYLYLNTAIGGDWPGSPDATTIFPQYFEIDYVRVYQKAGGDK